MQRKKITQVQKLRKRISDQARLIKEYEAVVSKQSANIAPDPVQVIMSALEAQAPLAQHQILEDIASKIALKRLTEAESCENSHYIAQARLEDFQKRHPQFIKYKATL